MYYEKMPNPFDLLQPSSTENKSINQKKENTKEKGIKEGMGGTIADSPDPSPAVKSQFNGTLAAAFFMLAIFMGIIYYFNSSFMLLSELNTKVGNPAEYYKSTNFNEFFGGKLQSSFIVIFLILWMAVFALNILLCKVVINVADINQIIYMTTIYFFGIVGCTMAIINNIPSLIEVFENTIGFWVLPWTSNMKEATTIFKNKAYENNDELQKMGISINHDFLLTTFSLPNFHEHFDHLTKKENMTNNDNKMFYIDKDDATDENRSKLLKLTLQKYTIGHYVWMLIASYISILLTVNSLPG